MPSAEASAAGSSTAFARCHCQLSPCHETGLGYHCASLRQDRAGMASYSTNEFRSGLKVMLEGDPCSVLENEFVKPAKARRSTRSSCTC